MAYKWWLLTTYKSWDDPPSTSLGVPENPIEGGNSGAIFSPGSDEQSYLDVPLEGRKLGDRINGNF